MSKELASALRESRRHLDDYAEALRVYRYGVGYDQKQAGIAKTSLATLSQALLCLRDAEDLPSIDRAAVSYLRGLTEIGAMGSADIKDAKTILDCVDLGLL